MNASYIENQLHHLYISPLEKCNLCCKMCYTTKTNNRLSGKQMIDFIHRYDQVTKVQTVTFCGGEVFLLPDMLDTINALTQEGIFVQVITNGTIDIIEKFSHPNQINLIVSIDGLPTYHDLNRGNNRWRQSIDFMRKALQYGCHVEVFSIITKENLDQIDAFEAKLTEEFGKAVAVTYHPRKPMEYLQRHPLSNQVGETTGFSFISASERNKLSEHHHVFPGPNFGCYQISLMSDGKVYGCCEGIRPIGSLDTDIHQLIKTFKSRIDTSVNCVEPDFMCGLADKSNQEKSCH